MDKDRAEAELIAEARSRLVFALDVDDMESAREWISALKDEVGVIKIGYQLFLRAGGGAVELARSEGFEVFLDLKFHDIPRTVERAARQAVRMGAFMFNVHASGGRAMMEAAARGAMEEAELMGARPPVVLGVTVLTSMDEADLAETGAAGTPAERADLLAGLARESGLSGVVASALEAQRIRELAGEGFVILCPGIRPPGSDLGDQVRVTTPGRAVAAGADYLVVGRPVREAPDPAAAARKIVADMARALAASAPDAASD